MRKIYENRTEYSTGRFICNRSNVRETSKRFESRDLERKIKNVHFDETCRNQLKPRFRGGDAWCVVQRHFYRRRRIVIRPGQRVFRSLTLVLQENTFASRFSFDLKNAPLSKKCRFFYENCSLFCIFIRANSVILGSTRIIDYRNTINIATACCIRFSCIILLRFSNAIGKGTERT